MPAAIAGPGIAGPGIAALHEFIARQQVAEGLLEPVLTGWSGTRSSLYLVTPPNGPKPARVRALMDFFIEHLSRTD